MNKKEILDILDNAKDESGAVPMRLVRQAFDKLPTVQSEKAQLSQEGTTKGTPYLKEYATADPDTAIGGLREMGDNLLREIHSRAMSRMGDCISRKDAIRWIKTECNPYGKPTLDFESGKRVMKHLEQMPPAQPNRKTGHWIEASVAGMPALYHEKCGAFVYAPNGKKGFNFCPNCGADMRGEQE